MIYRLLYAGGKMRNSAIYDKIDNFTAAQEIKSQGIYPYFREITTEQSTDVYLKSGKKVLMLGSNSYMGLTNHPEVKKAAIDAIEKYGTGCAGSRFLNGTLDIHTELEIELAEFVGKEAALLYSTGYQVNLGVITTVPTRHDHIILDSYNHASIIDASRLSAAKVHRYNHSDMADLEKILSSIPYEKGKFLISDGIFSMEGDIAQLDKIILLAEKYNASVMIDDAHATGVIGKNGRGTSNHFGLTNKVDIIMTTFSKSLASIGGFVAADKQTIDFLKHHSRPLIFSASMPPASAASALAALRILKREPERLARLWNNTTSMRNGLKSLGFQTGISETPVIPIYIGQQEKVFLICKALENEGLFVNPVIPPAIPKNNALIRISLMATHTKDHIEFALKKMAKVGKEFGVI